MVKLGNQLSTFFFLCGLLIIFLISGVEASQSHEHRGSRKPTRLFVFGDSYVDTGNIWMYDLDPWMVPYGITFPGHATGRFSDGRLLTDYIAMFLGLKSPIPYSWREKAPEKAKHGVNFAFGGSGVFNTWATSDYGFPNMTIQIDLFQQMLSGNDIVHIDGNLTDSVALVSAVGNDYSTFLANGSSTLELPGFIVKVVNQLALNLQRLYSLGMTKILVAGLQPLGCSPQSTAINSFQECSKIDNAAVQLHNLLLRRAVAKLNNQSKASKPPVVILDLYNTFLAAFEEKDNHSGNLKFKTPLKPCCFGINASWYCSNVDTNGNKLYTLCDDPSSAFFWDRNHPTEAGWVVVYGLLKATLKKFFH